MPWPRWLLTTIQHRPLARTLMPNTNPGRELMCPVCPKKLRYVTTRNIDGYVHRKDDAFMTVADVHVYECASHGRFHMGPNGRLSAGS